MCWPRSSSAPVMLFATSSTREAIASEISAMSWRRSIWTPEMALRTCSAWPPDCRADGRVLQQGANAHFVVAIGALERGDLVGDEGFKFAGARDRAFDAVAHRGDLAADRLTDGHHGIGGRGFGLGEADRDLRHRLRDHPHFLAAPGEAREEIEQQHRRKEQRGKAGQHQHAAALSDRRLQRGQEADGQQAATDHPDAAKHGGKRVDAAGRAALLDRLQNLSDGFAIVIGGATGAARLLDRIEHRPLGASARVKRHIGIGRRSRRTGLRGEFVAKRISIGVDVRIADVERFLNGGERDLSRIFDLLRIVRHVSRALLTLYAPSRSRKNSQARSWIHNPPRTQAYPPAACPHTSANILLVERYE
jgi:hypothetical protein